ncbi:unnamed protein product [Rotaria magnacalcarata]|uniref:Uncharacterized protein n=1 Tax=Rotaria magnacalcarata TaxID=392030 RepID=A0A816VT55_9BILA|nr:unnamed protein product [Rotaria magnacalcarata]
MPAKKNKSKQKPTKLRETNQNKYILLRDIDTLTQLMVDYDRVSSNKNAKINVAAEVIYTKTDQSVGHGTVLTIGSKEECQELLDALEKHNTMKSKEDIQPIVTIDDHEEIQEIEDEREQQSITKSSNASPVIEHVNNKTTVSNESPSPKNKRSLPLTNKDLNVSEENASASKRLKSEDKSNDYQRARIMILQEKCEKLQERIDEMENNWMRYKLSEALKTSHVVTDHEEPISPISMPDTDATNETLKIYGDGELHRKIQGLCQDPFITLSLNIDGIQPNKGSKKTIWPILLVVNEIPLKYRFAPENLILAGVWPGATKPTRTYIAHFLKPVVAELSHLEDGVAFYLQSDVPSSNRQIVRIRVYLIGACCDKPAQALVQNIPEPIGAFGCGRCEVEVKYFFYIFYTYQCLDFTKQHTLEQL